VVKSTPDLVGCHIYMFIYDIVKYYSLLHSLDDIIQLWPRTVMVTQYSNVIARKSVALYIRLIGIY